MEDNKFLAVGKDYRQLIVYRKTECVYDITFFFANKFLGRGDRTVDQMIQAARSGKQNIAEGISDGATSMEMCIKLLNCAKGSLKELVEDYRDYLRVRGLTEWSAGDERLERTKRLCREHSDSAFYRHRIEERSDEALANIAITLICQTDYLLYRLIARLQDDFVKNGGVKERMYRARIEYRNGNKG